MREFFKSLLTFLKDNRGMATLNLHTYVAGQEFDSAVPEFY